jgi:hypothetical protein
LLDRETVNLWELPTWSLLSAEGFLDQRVSDAAISPGHQN